MSATEESLALLKRIAEACEKSATILDRMSRVAPVANAAGEVADDRDLDSQYGNEQVRFNPRDWIGESFKGRTMSECPPEFLDMLASSHDFFAQKNANAGDAKKAGYDRRSAGRARGWAKRLRSGWKRPDTEQQNEAGADDENTDDRLGGGGW